MSESSSEQVNLISRWLTHGRYQLAAQDGPRRVAPGGVVRVTDSTTLRTGEFYFGANICHNNYGPAWAMLCEGACSAVSCSNTLDYFEQTDAGGARPSGFSSCATFTPAPLNSASATSSQSSTRIGFAGGGTAGLRSDWAIRTVTR